MEIVSQEHKDFYTIKEKVRQIMSNLFDEDIADDLIKDQNDKWDSLGHLNLIVSLENEFAISFTPEEIGGVLSFEDIVNTVSSKLHI